MSLPEKWIDRIFGRLQGIYGAQFTGKFSRMDQGVDVGMLNAKNAWADELETFSDWPEAIAYALDHLPTAHAPNALEFRDICRRAPRKSEAVAVIEYKPSEEDKERHREMSRKASEAVKPKEFDGLLWAKKPKSQKAMDMVADAKKHASRFPALAQVFDYLVKNDICSPEGKLLHRWDGVRWEKCR